MLIHVIYSSEGRSQEVGILDCPAAKEWGGSQSPPPTDSYPPPRPSAAYPHSSQPAPSADNPRTLTLVAARHVLERPELRSCRPAPRPRLPCRPRHTFLIPSRAGAPSSRSRGPPAARRFPLRSWFGKTFSAGGNLGVSRHLSVCRTCQCVWRFPCMKVTVTQACARVWERVHMPAACM